MPGNYVTDTHSLVWYFTEDPQLSRKAFQAFERTVEGGSIIIPAVVMAEVMYISKKGRVRLSFMDTTAKIEAYDNFDVAPLDLELLKTADTIAAQLEMHDRLIVATALHYEATLITKDANIRKQKIVATIW